MPSDHDATWRPALRHRPFRRGWTWPVCVSMTRSHRWPGPGPRLSPGRSSHTSRRIVSWLRALLRRGGGTAPGCQLPYGSFSRLSPGPGPPAAGVAVMTRRPGRPAGTGSVPLAGSVSASNCPATVSWGARPPVARTERMSAAPSATEGHCPLQRREQRPLHAACNLRICSISLAGPLGQPGGRYAGEVLLGDRTRRVRNSRSAGVR